MRCVVCHHEKPAEAFYAKDKTCKACRCEKVRANRLAKLDQYRAYDRQRAGQPHRAQARDAYQKTPEFAQAHGKACRRYRERHPLKRAAHEAVSNAIRDGRLIRPAACSIPGCSGKPEAHHFDYSRPLSVVWLCDEHHKSAHSAEREIQRATP